MRRRWLIWLWLRNTAQRLAFVNDRAIQFHTDFAFPRVNRCVKRNIRVQPAFGHGPLPPQVGRIRVMDCHAFYTCPINAACEDCNLNGFTLVDPFDNRREQPSCIPVRAPDHAMTFPSRISRRDFQIRSENRRLFLSRRTLLHPPRV